MAALDEPTSILEIGAGGCEFINQCGAAEKWAIDCRPDLETRAAGDERVRIGRIQDVSLKGRRFEAVFMSNFLEHLDAPEEAAEVLAWCRENLNPGGRIGILGPNFRYAWREYFDCCDHRIALTHRSVAEHLAGAGFARIRTIPRTLPFSFRSAFPAAPCLVRLYLRLPILWRFFGKQYFVRAERPD